MQIFGIVHPYRKSDRGAVDFHSTRDDNNPSKSSNPSSDRTAVLNDLVTKGTALQHMPTYLDKSEGREGSAVTRILALNSDTSPFWAHLHEA